MVNTMKDNKILVFDMDETLNRFYGVQGWLDDLHNNNPRPYILAENKYDMDIINPILNLLKSQGWKIVVTTWLAKDSNKDYDDLVRICKTDWLNRYEFPYDEIHMVKYGTTKANCTRKLGGYQILFDDNEKIRNGWTLGATVNANEDIIPFLTELLVKELD